MSYLIITSIHSNIVNSKYCHVLKNIEKFGLSAVVYHENSYSTPIDLPNISGVTYHDVFKVNPDLRGIVEMPELKAIEKVQNENIKKKHAKYWVRKSFAEVHAIRAYSSLYDYIVLCDADAYFTKLLDDKFFDWMKDYDIGLLSRQPPAPETGFVCWNNSGKIQRFMEYYADYYTTGTFLGQARWCDTRAIQFSVETFKPQIKEGKIQGARGIYDRSHLARDKDSSPFSIEDYWVHDERDSSHDWRVVDKS